MPLLRRSGQAQRQDLIGVPAVEVDRINARLRAKREAGEGKDAEAKELKGAAGAIGRDYLPRMERYERQQAAFAGRKSFSKTVWTPRSCG